MDGVLRASECIDERIQEGIPRVICKLDMETAHGHVNCDFLYYLLGRFKFKLKWRWMWKCLNLASFSVLLNGVSTGFYEGSRGLRPRDPLSPLLFLLLVKVFGGMLKWTADHGLIERFSIGNDNVKVTHL